MNVATTVLANLALNLFDHLAEDHFCVAYSTVVGTVVFVDIFSAVCRMAKGNTAGHRGVEVGYREAGAHAKNEVGLFQEVLAHHGARRCACTESQRVVFWEAALTSQGRHNRDVGQLSELDKFICRLGVHDALSGVDDGSLSGK